MQSLFGPDFDTALKTPLRDCVDRLAQEGTFIGTSSWKYPGWIGQLYSAERYEVRRKVSKERFEAECLSEYAETFRSVSVDAGYYQFPTPQYIEKLTSQVPDHFRFSFKVTDEITLKHFPKVSRHGEKAGKSNPHFLNAELFQNSFLVPLTPHRAKIGVLMFEFAAFSQRDFESGNQFVESLDQFLEQLPREEWQFGVEIRNRTFLEPGYFALLRKHNVAHVFNSWTAMPPVDEQIQIEGAFPADFFAARFLLKPGRTYEEAVKSFSPYQKTKEVQPAERKAIRELGLKKTRKGSYIYVNNRLEGNALLTILRALEILEGKSSSPGAAENA